MINQNSMIKNVLGSIISITRFNRGEAGKIFEEVTKQGTKIVFKNNVPACVLVDPIHYEEMMEALEDYALLFEAESRMKATNPDKALPMDQVLERYNITQADLDDIEVEIE